MVDDAETRSQPSVGISARHILVAEDSTALRLMIEARLRGWGWRVTGAATGYDAVNLLVRHRFNLVLMDLHMPDMDGRTAIRRLRTLGGARAATPAIAFTGDTALTTANAHGGLAVPDGFDAAVIKPPNWATLRRLILALAKP